MAIIDREGKVMTWENLGLDKYLRQSSSPLLSDSPVTVRGVLGGQQVVSNSGNVMPKSIGRDKLGNDALLFSLNINAVATAVIQAATGYDVSLNNYIYVATWDGTNYAVRRFNTLNLMAPYQDAFILNSGLGLAGAEAMSSINSIAVTNTGVAVTYTTDAGNRYMATLDFALNFVSRVRAAFVELSAASGADFDGIYLNSVANAAAGADIHDCVQQNDQQGYTIAAPSGGSGAGSFDYQTFKTGPNTTTIDTVEVRVDNPDLNFSGGVSWSIQTADGVTTLASGSFTLGTNAPAQWVSLLGTSISVSPNTNYRITLFEQGTESPHVRWRAANGNNYADGNLFRHPSSGADVDQAKDACFRIDSPIPSGYSGKNLIQFNLADYSLAGHQAWPVSTNLPTQLAAFDHKFHYGYDSVGKQIIKFLSSGGTITIATTQSIQESVLGILWFNSFVYVVYTIGTSLVATPVSI